MSVPKHQSLFTLLWLWDKYLRTNIKYSVVVAITLKKVENWEDGEEKSFVFLGSIYRSSSLAQNVVRKRFVLK